MSLHEPKPTDSTTARRQVRDLAETIDDIGLTVDALKTMDEPPAAIIAALAAAAETIGVARDALLELAHDPPTDGAQ